MAMSVEVRNALVVVAVSVIAYKLVKLLWDGVWTPLRLRRVMAKQGVTGPPFRLLVGHDFEEVAFVDSFPENMPLGNYTNFAPTVTPQFALYSKYGKNFIYSRGTKLRMAVRDPEIAKELFVHNQAFSKRSRLEHMLFTQVIGKGLASLVGDKWATERRTLNPSFHQDALKGMVETMVEGAATETQKWEQTVAQAGGSAEIDLEPGLHKISRNILSHTAFSGDYEKGGADIRARNGDWEGDVSVVPEPCILDHSGLQVGMIINETLRVFPPAPLVTRETTKDLQLNGLFIPKGLLVEIAITAIHQDKDYLGEDVGEFNPERFANGVSKACSHPRAFMPFGLGYKVALGITSP